MIARRYSRFCGIDVAKDAHVARIIDRDGQTVAKPKSFANTAAGYQLLLTRLVDAGGPAKVLIGMEATGHYWLSLHEFLTTRGYKVEVLNPIQTAQQAKKGIRTAKTDKIDTKPIAVVIKNGDYRSAIIPGELAYTCRQLTRLRYWLINQATHQAGALVAHSPGLARIRGPVQRRLCRHGHPSAGAGARAR